MLLGHIPGEGVLEADTVARDVALVAVRLVHLLADLLVGDRVRDTLLSKLTLRLLLDLHRLWKMLLQMEAAASVSGDRAEEAEERYERKACDRQRLADVGVHISAATSRVVA